MDLKRVDTQGGRPATAGCCLTPQELAERTAEWRRLGHLGLRQAVIESEDLVLTYRRGPEVEAELRYLVAQEKVCCSTLRFEISIDAETLTLRISGPWRETPWSGALEDRHRPQSPGHGPAISLSGGVREYVRQRYGAVARGSTAVRNAGTGPSGIKSGCGVMYDPGDLEILADLPEGISLGCGNAIGSAELKEGEVVLDLGSGAGLDVLIAAKRVGASGKVYGLDMTDEMLELGKRNQAAAAVTHVEFLRGYIEEIPLPEACVDVVVSNCVINLSASKPAVFREMSRVLRSGGRIAVSDVVAEGGLGEAEAADFDAWGGCLAGALTREQYRSGLESAGFSDVAIIQSHEIQPGFASVLVKGKKP